MLTPKIQNVYGATVDPTAETLSVDSWGKKLSDLTADELNYSGAKLRNTASNDDVNDFFRTGATFNNSIPLVEVLRLFVLIFHTQIHILTV